MQTATVAQPVTTTMLTEPVYENVAGVPVEPQETCLREKKVIGTNKNRKIRSK